MIHFLGNGYLCISLYPLNSSFVYQDGEIPELEQNLVDACSAYDSLKKKCNKLASS